MSFVKVVVASVVVALGSGSDGGGKRVGSEWRQLRERSRAGLWSAMPSTAPPAAPSGTARSSPRTPLGSAPQAPELGPYFASGGGKGVFTPNGNFAVTCHGVADLTTAPTFVGSSFCFAIRGGDVVGHGGKHYFGTGTMIVNPSGNVTITRHGSFGGIASYRREISLGVPGTTDGRSEFPLRPRLSFG
jgi:hypothetical protein